MAPFTPTHTPSAGDTILAVHLTQNFTDIGNYVNGTPDIGTPSAGVLTNCTGTATGLVAGTVATAAQPAITSLGTLTTLTVDDITINGNTISSAGASSLAITPTAGQVILLDGAISIDAGVITGVTSLTSTNITGTVATAAQPNITSVGTLTAPKIGTSILDVNGLELMTLTATASAVNEITLANAATGSNPTVTASGNDTNIGINLVSKGTGKIQIGGVQVPVSTDLYNYRTGLSCSRASATTITVTAGEIMVDGTPVRKQTDTTLTLTSAGDWVDNTSDQAVSTYGYIYINNAGTMELDDAAPDASDSSDNTSGALKYNNTGTDTSWRRCIGKFYMNATGSGELDTNAVSSFNEGLPVASGRWELLGTTVASTQSSVDFVTLLSSDHDTYMVILEDVSPTTDAATLYCRFSTSGTFNSGASDYAWATDFTTVAAVGSGAADIAAAEIKLGAKSSGTTPGETFNGTFIIHNITKALRTWIVGNEISMSSAPDIVVGNNGGMYLTEEANDGIRFLFSSGNILGGTFKLYGLRV